MKYSDFLLRGISNKNNDIDENGFIRSHVFFFGKKQNTTQRIDDYNEESIFWKDDDGAIDLLLNQKKEDGSIQFKGGAGVLKREYIDNFKIIPEVSQRLSYERSKNNENPYHGNLLLKKDTTDVIMKQIAGYLALCCTEIIPQKTTN